jgi:hypothetical protein
MEGMEEILKGLQHMRTTNPEAFKQAMLSLGLPVEENNGSIVDDSVSLSKMAEAIKQMRVGESQNCDEGAIGAGVHIGKKAPTQVRTCIPLECTSLNLTHRSSLSAVAERH